MAASKGATAKGVVLSIGTPGGSESFIPVVQMKTMQFTNSKVTFEDITNLSSPTLGDSVIQESQPTLINPGEFSGQALYLPSDAGYAALLAAWTGQSYVDVKLQFQPIAKFGQMTTGTLFAFSGWLQEQPLPDGFSADKSMMFKLSIKLNTAVVITPGA